MPDLPDLPDLVDKTIVVTGPTGIVGAPLVADLARENTIIALARFSNDATRAALESQGVTCHRVDLAAPDFTGIPSDVDVVVNLAVAKSGNWRTDLAANAEGAGRLMSHFRSAGAFFHCSTGAVYRPNGGEPFTVGDPHGDHHASMMPTYSISKISTESVVRFAAEEFELPTVIARLNVPYSDTNGWPWFHLQMMRAGMEIEIHPDGSRYNLIHAEDITADLPVLLGQASVAPTVINWASPGTVSIEEWCTAIAELDGLEPPTFTTADTALPSTVMELSAIAELRPARTVGWTAGIERLVAANPAASR